MSKKNAFVVKKSTLCFMMVTLSSLLAVGSTALAQSEDTVELEAIEVTGTRIKRTEIEGSSPVVVLDRQYIEESGATTLNQLFKNVIYNTAGAIDESFTQATTPGAAAIDLRGLGVNRTLVLLNGRRVPVSPFSIDGNSFVDINLIPLGAVERIEILKDGASAIYGSDAIAGVVNIILRKDYEGAEVAVYGGGTDQGDGWEGQITATGGKTTDKGNVTFVLDLFDRGAVMARDRDLTQSANRGFDDRSSAGDPGTIIRLDQGGALLPDPRCPASSQNPERGPFCLYDFAPWNTLIPAAQRLGLVASGDYEIDPGLIAFFGANYTYSQSDRDLAPPAPNDVFVIGPDNPNNPFPGEPILSIYRPTELGARTDEVTTDAWNLVGGLKGTIATWNWELGVGGGKVDSRVRGINGYATQEAVQSAIDSGALNPFGPSPNFDPASIRYEPRRDGESSLFFTDLKATGPIWQMQYGPLSAAVGAEYRSEDFSDQFDPITASGEVLGTGGTSGEGDRQVAALYAEFSIPAAKNFEINLAGRYDDYSDFGGTFNPKLGLRWKPLDNLLVRGSAGTGFKAPSLPELYSGETLLFANVFDPVTGRVRSNIRTINSGNPDLDPEDSNNYDLGLIWDINHAWNFGVDFWRIDVDNVVSNNPQYYVDNEAQFPDNVVRNSRGQIVEVRNPYRNIAKVDTSGIDFSTYYRWSTTDAGDFGFTLVATYLGTYDEQQTPEAESRDLAGKNGRPRWRGQAILNWEKDVYQGAFIVNYVGGYDRVTETIQPYRVGSWTTVDAQFDWDLSAKAGNLGFGINNLFDTEPPEELYWTEGWPWYNRALHSARGRFLYARYKYKF
jgi:outer membrane receptor protein involved in Fe transport